MPIVVGVALEDTVSILSRFQEAGVLDIVTRPLLIMSSPDEYANPKIVDALQGKDDKVKVVPFAARYVYNPKTFQTEVLIAVKAEESGVPLDSLRKDVLGISSDKEFIPYFILGFDPHRTSNARAYMNSVTDQLLGLVLSFELTTVDDSTYVVKAFNTEAQQQFTDYMYDASYNAG